jgi:hypothetical protein
MNEIWVWSMQGMIVNGEKWHVRSKNCPSAILSITGPTQTSLRSNHRLLDMQKNMFKVYSEYKVEQAVFVPYSP